MQCLFTYSQQLTQTEKIAKTITTQKLRHLPNAATATANTITTTTPQL